jgi:hypothetical protein
MRPLVAWLRQRSRPTRPIRCRPPYVEALEDRLLPTAYVVTTTKDILGDTTPGEVTLRDAITALDGTPSGNATAVGTATNSITFALAESGPQTIAVGSDPSAASQSLPAISKQVLLDGWSQGGAGYQGPPLIVLNGANAGDGAAGLALNAGSDGSTIRGLVLQAFGGAGIDVNGSSRNLIVGNYSGTDATGAAPESNFDGVLLHGGATANTVGGTAAGAGNVLSGNSYGADITDIGTSSNLVLGNFLGTDRTGTAALGNSRFGLRIADASANTVGGLVPAAANVISGNDPSEDTCGMQIGGVGASGNLVVGNRIGTDVTGTVSLHNSDNGVGIVGGATANTIGGTTPGAANLISGNGYGPGVELDDPTTTGNVVLGNLIGTDPTGTRALGNSTGILIRFGALGNTIGGTAPGAANVISGNGNGGVAFSYGASGDMVLGNLIGTDITGTQPLGNVGAGLNIDSGTGNTIGGTAPGAGNVISGNGDGISISGSGTSGNVVEGNLIGTDKTGLAPLGNQGPGFYLFSESSANSIGGTAPGAGNVIAGNQGDGIDIIGFADRYTVQGNLIGTDITGTRALGNAGDGIILGNDGNTIGGTIPGAGNVISGNGGRGVAISSINASSNVVQGNLIGTDISGTQPLGNALDGVSLDNFPQKTTIGGTTAGAGNIIAANGRDGVRLSNAGVGVIWGISASGTLVAGNRIGTDRSGSRALGNAGNGVTLDTAAEDNTVGGTVPGAGNVIAHNAKGVVIADSASTGNSVLGNSLFSNTGPGIDLGDDGPTPNGANPRNFPNHGQNSPTITALSYAQVSGTLSSTPKGNFRLEFFASPPAAGAGEGESLLGSLDVITDGTGTVSFVAPVVAIPPGSVVTATATNLATGDTSEFSPGLVFQASVYVVTTAKDALGDTTPGELTLRDALTAVDGTPSGNATVAGAAQNIIEFAIPGSGPRTILVGSDPSAAGLPLPAIGNSVFLDGWSQGGAGYVGVPLVVLSGGHAGAGADGLQVNTGAGGSVVRGLGIQQFNGNGLELRGASGVQIVGNLIGTVRNGLNGLLLDAGAANNTIGGSGASNVFSNNGLNGIEIAGPGTSGNVVLSNFIGTDSSRSTALGNGADGVRIDTGAAQNTVGGTAAGAGNVIAYNAKGVVVADSASTGDSILGNSLFANTGPGIDLGDDGPTPNGANPRNFANHGQNSPTLTALSYARVSGTMSSSPTSNFRLEFFASPPAAGASEGQSPLASFDVTTDGTGTVSFAAPVVAIPPGSVVTATATNLATGDTSEFSSGLLFQPNVYVVTTTKDALGDTTPGELTLRDALTALDGTPSGNATNVGTANNVIVFAISGSGPQTIVVGSDPTAPAQPLPAITRSVFLDGWSQEGFGDSGTPLIVLNGADTGTGSTGLTLSPGGDGSTIRGLVIQQFGGDGIEVNGASGNVITGDYLGSDVGGTVPVGNGGDGVLIHQGAVGNTVGGTAAGAGNLISEGARASGVEITDAGTSGNVLLGNLIGTDISGTVRLADTGDIVQGVLIHGGATANTVGGTAPGSSNLISGNATRGDFPFGGAGRELVISGTGTSGNVVLGNLIGTNISGTANLGKYVEGVVLEAGASGNTIGGTAAGAANVISGNSNGIEILDAATSGNLVLGNLIGTDRTGTRALGNSNQGVHIADAPANTVGGTSAGAGNVISGQTFSEDSIGLEILGSGATGNLVIGNRVGTDFTGTSALPNSYDGVHVGGGATANKIGGTTVGAGNLISGNQGPGVELSDNATSSNVVLGNRIGTDITGTQALGNDTGVLIRFGAPGNTVGGLTGGSANLISGNRRIGVDLSYGTLDNVVVGNLIGTDPTGTLPLGNAFKGVWIESGTGNTVGGTAAGAANVISGNSGDGLAITGTGTSGNVVIGNLIGTDKRGTARLGNLGQGVDLYSESSGNTVGGTAPGAGNVISGNANSGVAIVGFADKSAVVGNLIGTDVTGTAALPNGGDGIIIGNDGNTVGGTAPGAGNVISGNSGNGINISSPNASANLVLGNLIGTDIHGSLALANTGDGVYLNNGARANTVGGPAAGGNLISGNTGSGVEFGSNGSNIFGVPTSGNVVLGNLIGTSRGGNARLGNAQDGVLIDAFSSSNTVGGTIPGSANVLSANGRSGIVVGTNNNLVLGNLIGTDRNGTAALGNTEEGVFIPGGAHNTVGGTAAGAGNVISGNVYGVFIEGGAASGNAVLGNRIGTDAAGTARLGNSQAAVLLYAGATGNTVGGLAPRAGNVLSGNYVGLFLYSAGTSGNVALGNLIGTDRTGTRPLGNQFGVAIGGGAANNIVGGNAAGAGNVISANGYGVDLFDTGTSGNVFLGNRIGTDRSGTLNLGNTFDGVILEGGASRDVIGGTAPSSGNIIAFNAKGVVLVDDGATGDPIQGDSILGNRIFANTGPGIDINDDGPTPNGANPRSLPNRGQNAPIVTQLTRTSVSGTLTSIARTTFRLEFFASPRNGSAYQGQIYLGCLNVATGASGAVSFVAPVSAIPAGCIVTATATNLATGDTSEFSPAGPQLLMLSSPTIVLSTQAQVITLSAQLFSGNTPLVGARVTFRIVGLPGTVTGTVGANGVVTVTFKVPPGARAGTYVITASYGGISSDDVLTIAEPFRRIGNIGGRQS